MADPLVSAGTLNLTLSSMTVTAFPALNITPSVLAKNMVRLGIEGEATRHLPAAVSAVTSPEVYMMASITLALLKTQPIVASYKTQLEVNSILGDVTVRTDSATLPPFKFVQCGIVDVREMSFAGDEPEMGLVIRGVYRINSGLWP